MATASTSQRNVVVMYIKIDRMNKLSTVRITVWQKDSEVA